MRNHSTRGKNTKKGIASFLALLSFTAYMPVSCLPSFAADIAANALPDLNQAINGSVDKIGDNKLNVNVQGGQGTVGQFDWNSFNVGKDANVNWVFSANSQTALNRVLASGGMSYIYGKLTESSASNCPSCTNTSKVILINPSGMLFGNGSSVNLNSFTASTYDINGVRNLKDMSADELAAYGGNNPLVNGRYSTAGNGGLYNIAGYNKTISYVANDNRVDGNGMLIVNPQPGSKLASILAEGSDIKADKTIAMVGNNIDISNSKLSTKYTSLAPNVSNNTQNRSTIKLITGDGVNFKYTSAGNVDGNISYTKATKGNDVDYNLNISDSEIRTGNFVAYNTVDGDRASVNIDNSMIYTKKLVGTDFDYNGTHYTKEQTGTNGELQILSDGKISITNSDIQTTNDKNDATGEVLSSGIGYGDILIDAAKEVTIKNTQMRTADSKLNTDSTAIKAGNITISSDLGDVNIIQDGPVINRPADGDNPGTNYTDMSISAGGDLTIKTTADVNIEGYDKIQAVGHGSIASADVSSNTNRTINISGANVSFDGTKAINADKINVNSDSTLTVKDSAIVGNTANLLARDTAINNSLLQYNDLAFYDAAGSKVNNVTITNGSTFNDKNSTALTIETNGDLVVGNASLQKKAYGSDTATNQRGITLRSTTGDVTVQNGSNITSAGGPFAITATNGKVNVNDSTVYASGANMTVSGRTGVEANNSTIWAKDGKMTVNSTRGKLTAIDSRIVAEGGDTAITQYGSMNIDTDLAGSTIGATNELSITSSAGSITGSTLEKSTGHINDYEGLVSLNNNDADTHFIFAGATLNANQDINVTDLKSAQAVDFVAGQNINLNSTGDMTLTDVSTSAGGTTNIAAVDALTTDGFDVVNGTKTTLSGLTVTTKGDSAINTNGKKLAVNADGNVNIAVTGVNNSANGLEINADVNTSAGSDVLSGKKVTVNAKDGTLAIAKIKADTLDLTADTILKADTTISAATDNVSGLVADGVDMSSKGYIEIATEGGFNLDPTVKYQDGSNVKYNSNHDITVDYTGKVNIGDEYSKDVVDSNTERVTTKLDTEITKGELVKTEMSDEVNVGDPKIVEWTRTESDENGNYSVTTTYEQKYNATQTDYYEAVITDTFEDKDVTTTTTTTTTYQDWQADTTTNSGQHVATLNDAEDAGFVLVYGKNSVATETGTDVVGTPIVDTQVTENIVNAARKEVTVSTNEADLQKEYSLVENLTRRYDVTESCKDEIFVEPDFDIDEYDPSSTVRNPRKAEGTSNSAPVQTNIIDSQAMSVAAAYGLQFEDDEDKDADDDRDLIEE